MTPCPFFIAAPQRLRFTDSQVITEQGNGMKASIVNVLGQVPQVGIFTPPQPLEGEVAIEVMVAGIKQLEQK